MCTGCLIKTDGTGERVLPRPYLYHKSVSRLMYRAFIVAFRPNICISMCLTHALYVRRLLNNICLSLIGD